MAADLELLPKKDRKRAEREAADAAKRAARRARTGALDLALAGRGAVAARRRGACATAPRSSSTPPTAGPTCGPTPTGRDAHRLRAGVALVDEARAALAVHPTEELLLEALASRLARELAS